MAFKDELSVPELPESSPPGAFYLWEKGQPFSILVFGTLNLEFFVPLHIPAFPGGRGLDFQVVAVKPGP